MPYRSPIPLRARRHPISELWLHSSTEPNARQFKWTLSPLHGHSRFLERYGNERLHQFPGCRFENSQGSIEAARGRPVPLWDGRPQNKPHLRVRPKSRNSGARVGIINTHFGGRASHSQPAAVGLKGQSNDRSDPVSPTVAIKSIPHQPAKLVDGPLYRGKECDLHLPQNPILARMAGDGVEFGLQQVEILQKRSSGSFS